jgi:peroxiredoxin
MKNILLVTLLLVSSTSIFSQNKPVGLLIDQTAPDFTAKDQYGKSVNLQAQLKKSSVVLVFYRGQWCPYCNKQLSELEDSLKVITAKGATIIAISPEKSENIEKTVSKTKASYSILHDEGLSIMKKYDVAFKVDAATVSKYKDYGIDFAVANGETNGAYLPVPAVYIINKKGKIIYRYFDENYRKRPSVKALIDNL